MIDLHTHSRFSDGSATPTEVIDLAVEAGLTAIALTDHDGLAGLTEAEDRAKAAGIDFVRGCEVSASFQPGSLHLLCYFVPAEGALPKKLADLRGERERRNEKLLELLSRSRLSGSPAKRSSSKQVATSSGDPISRRY